MIKIFFLVCVLHKIQGQLASLIFTAPSAISHQSRIDMSHTPGFISAPLVYSPIAGYTAVKESEPVLLPLVRTEHYFTPVVLTFFHNLPLARALQHPISIKKTQEEALAREVMVETVDSDNNDQVYLK